jgi:DNA-binding IclR family transcriptional regulator
MLGILAELGMVERTSDGAARPGAGLATLTRRLDDSPAVIRARLRPLAVDMRRTYGENAAVGVDDGSGFLYLFSARVPAAVQVADPVDRTYPFHLVAPGLVVMAGWTDARLAEYLAAPLTAATPNSVVDPAAIRKRLARIRRDGYAWTDQELDLEVNGLAAPIVNAAGATIAVATLYGPSYRFSEQRAPHLGREFASFVAERSEEIALRSSR